MVSDICKEIIAFANTKGGTLYAFKITLPNRNAAAGAVTASGVGKSYETRILEYMKTNGQAVRSDIDALLGVSQATASRILKQMLKSGLIYQEGKGRITRYKAK